MGPQGGSARDRRVDDAARPPLSQRPGRRARRAHRRPLVAQGRRPRRCRRPGDAGGRPPPRRRSAARSRAGAGPAHARPQRTQQVRGPLLCRRTRKLHGGAASRGRAPRLPAVRRSGGSAMIVGTAGHIDHGKTSLVRRLTGVDTDRLKEEKARGISIDLGFAYWSRPGGIIGFVDVPGHEGLVHNMLAGATGIDYVLLTIAADDGVMPQTREHLAIVDLLGITRGIVALTKADLAADERRTELETEIANVLIGTGLGGAPIVPVSVVTGEGIDDLRARLFAAAHETRSRAADGRFRLAVDR